MTSLVLMTIIQKQQHRQETAWEHHKHNGNIVSWLNVPHAAQQRGGATLSVCMWGDIRYPSPSQT